MLKYWWDRPESIETMHKVHIPMCADSKNSFDSEVEFVNTIKPWINEHIESDCYWRTIFHTDSNANVMSRSIEFMFLNIADAAHFRLRF